MAQPDSARSERRVYVEYERANGYCQDVPGTLDYWRDFLTNPNHSTEGPKNRRNPVVKLQERVENIEWGPVEALRG